MENVRHQPAVHDGFCFDETENMITFYKSKRLTKKTTIALTVFHSAIVEC